MPTRSAGGCRSNSRPAKTRTATHGFRTRFRPPVTRLCWRNVASTPTPGHCCTRKTQPLSATRSPATSRQQRSSRSGKGCSILSSAVATSWRRWRHAGRSRPATRPTQPVTTVSSRTPAWSSPAGSIRNQRPARSDRRCPTRNRRTLSDSITLSRPSGERFTPSIANSGSKMPKNGPTTTAR